MTCDPQGYQMPAELSTDREKDFVNIFLQNIGVNLGFWETAHLTLASHLGQNVGLGEG